MGAGLAAAQTDPADPSLGVVTASAILTLDQSRLFAESAYGKAVTARAADAESALAAENRRIETGLEQEERDLTERRKTTTAAEFALLADAFDTKVEAIRTAQDAKSRDIAQRRDEEQRRFVQVAGPVLGALMTEFGASVIIDKTVLILSLNAIDITAEAIVRLDAVLGDGSTAPAPQTPQQPAPDAPAPPVTPPTAP
ncbi:MAG: OmpH family outer membrane protein [Pseudomonadota bacterium]